MSEKKLLLLSNSTKHGDRFLQAWRKHIVDFIPKDVKEILFVPFASVITDWKTCTERVQEALERYKVINIYETQDMKKAVEEARCVCIGGGNTFNLLLNLQKYNLLNVIRSRILSGIPYIGWSAGSNVACIDIGCTNDMPIVWPSSPLALGLVDFNINPHYTEYKPPNYCGEGRIDRLNECLHVKQRPIVALSEGTGLLVSKDKCTVIAVDNIDAKVKIWLPDSKNESRRKIVDVQTNCDIIPILRG